MPLARMSTLQVSETAMALQIAHQVRLFPHAEKFTHGRLERRSEVLGDEEPDVTGTQILDVGVQRARALRVL